MDRARAPRRLREALAGRSFVHPAFDYLLIGGGLSLVVTGLVYLLPGSFSFARLERAGGAIALGSVVVLLSNSAHFASSTVRLYTKPGSWEAWPLLTLVFPLVALALLTLCIAQPESLGRQLWALHMTWSPFHYAAQAYGLAVMYSYRSGCLLRPGDKKLLRWVCLLPFFYAFALQRGAGLTWLVPGELLGLPEVANAHRLVAGALLVATLVAPPVLFARVARSATGPMPLISLLVVITNGIWWVALEYVDAFVWATIFHGIQYLAIVIIFHVKDQMARPDNRHGTVYHVLWFYGASVLLGYGLFSCLPEAYGLLGFGMVESMLLVVAAINVHHFVVDAFIWRLGGRDANRRIVDGGAPAPA